MSEVLLKVLGFLLRLIVFALTGNWPADDEVAEALPSPRSAADSQPSAGKSARFAANRGEANQGSAFVEGGAPAGMDARARVLADVETCLNALAAPVLEHVQAQATSLPALRFVTAGEHTQTPTNEAEADAQIITVRVSPSLAETPGRWVFLAREVGRSLFDAVPGWSSEIYGGHRLAPQLFLPPAQSLYDADTARAALGVWLPELFADAYATYTLGPAYAAALASSVARPQQPMETAIARAQGRWLSTSPPSVVRLHVALAVLTRLGFHEWEQTLRARFTATHGESDSLYLPLSDGRLMAIPSSFMLGELEPVLESLLDEPQDALGGETWLDVPGFAFLHGEYAQSEAVSQQLARGQAVDAPPRILLAAAVLSLRANAKLTPQVASALARSIRGADTLEAAPSAYDARTLGAAQPSGSLAAAFRDRSTVREAIILGAALGTTKRRPFRS